MLTVTNVVSGFSPSNCVSFHVPSTFWLSARIAMVQLCPTPSEYSCPIRAQIPYRDGKSQVSGGMAASCKSVAKASQVRILDLPQKDDHAPDLRKWVGGMTVFGELAFIGREATDRRSVAIRGAGRLGRGAKPRRRFS